MTTTRFTGMNEKVYADCARKRALVFTSLRNLSKNKHTNWNKSLIENLNNALHITENSRLEMLARLRDLDPFLSKFTPELAVFTKGIKVIQKERWSNKLQDINREASLPSDSTKIRQDLKEAIENSYRPIADRDNVLSDLHRVLMDEDLTEDRLKLISKLRNTEVAIEIGKPAQNLNCLYKDAFDTLESYVRGELIRE